MYQESPSFRPAPRDQPLSNFALNFDLRRYNKENDDRKLMGFEFLEILTRVAVAKYIKSQPPACADVSEVGAPSHCLPIVYPPWYPPPSRVSRPRAPTCLRWGRVLSSTSDWLCIV